MINSDSLSAQAKPSTKRIEDFLKGGLPALSVEKALAEDMLLLDVRTAEEFAKGSIPGARSFPLFDDLERKQDIANFLNLTEKGDGVRVFIGSENKLFSLSGSSLIISPYMNSEHKIIGAVGVIGPTRLNYGKIVPIVDYTAQLVGKTLLERG